MLSSTEKTAIFSKSLALIEKTLARVEQIDKTLFPTRTTEDVQQLLVDLLNALRDPVFLKAMEPQTLFNILTNMQKLVEDIEASTIDNISWPLVSYCDDIWNEFFGNTKFRIFYSVTRENIYGIYPFWLRLLKLLRKVLPIDKLFKIINDRFIFCCHLSSLEDTNLPLYANIAHEFGHPLYYFKQDNFHKIWKKSFDKTHHLLFQQFKRKATLKKIIKNITLKLAQELLADLFASLMMGPAFFLSLYEISWGSNKTEWKMRLSPNFEEMLAYPSFNFRLECIKDYAQLGIFEKDSKKLFEKVRSEKLKNIESYLSKIDINNDEERIKIKSDFNNDYNKLELSLNNNLASLKEGCIEFLRECNDIIIKEYGNKLTSVDVQGISHLLERLDYDILPNIIPDDTLLGVPARFQTILNASSIYRLSILSYGISGTKNITTDMIRDLSRDILKIERLTEKALEVSYIQQNYKRWESKYVHIK